MEQVFNQALAQHRAGSFDEAEALYRQAADWRPVWTLGNLGVLLRTTGRLDEAEAILREALRAEPGSPPVEHSLGMTLLQAGKYAEGWAFYEARRTVRPAPHPDPPFPEWRGEPLAGKRLLVVGEQGLGDQMLLARFVPLLAAQTAEVVVAAPKALVRLFAGLPARVIHPQGWDAVAADYWTFMASAPRWLEAGPADAPAPYLARPASGGGGIGLMLQGDPRNGNNAHRLPGKGVVRAIQGLADFTDLRPEATGARDMHDTAEIIAGLDLVVSVDTSVAHLAGAMGKPCLVLMSRPAIDWYTHWHDDRTPWHPSLKLLRQTTQGDWAGVIARLAQELAA